MLGHEAAALREELSRKADEVDLQILDLSLVFGEHSQVPPAATWKGNSNSHGARPVHLIITMM